MIQLASYVRTGRPIEPAEAGLQLVLTVLRARVAMAPHVASEREGGHLSHVPVVLIRLSWRKPRDSQRCTI